METQRAKSAVQSGFGNGADVKDIPVNMDEHETKDLMSDKRIVPKVYKKRWLILFLFATYSMTNAYQWIHLNIIGNVIFRYYNESLPGDNSYQKQVAIDWLSMVYMLAYVPLIFPATWLLDRKGLRIIGILGSLLNCLGAWLKCASVAQDRFWLLMLSQTICAIAQIFILGMPARLAAVWFGLNEVSTATAIGVFGNSVGNGLGFLIPPEVVPNSEDIDDVGYNLSILFYGGAGITTALFILVLIVFRKQPPVPPSASMAAVVEAAAEENYLESLKRLARNRGFLILTLTYGINTGAFYSVSTLLNPMVLDHFPGEELNAGRIGLTLVLAGLVGSVIGGIWLDKTKLFKGTTVGIYCLSLGSLIAYTFVVDYVPHIAIVFVCGGLLGLFMTGYLPVGFEFAAELTYPESEGTSSGLLNASAQIFGIVFTLCQGALRESHGTLAANLLLCAALLVGTILTAIIKSDNRRQAAAHKHEEEIKSKIEQTTIVE